MEVHSDQEMFKMFRKSGVHGKQWPNEFFCVGEVESGGKLVTLVERNEDGFHAERNIISRLRAMVIDDTLSSPTMTWFLSCSPCSNCSDAIVSFLNEAEEIHGVKFDLTIHFAALYKIRRPSCESGQHSHSHRLPSYKEHSRNVNGLSRLQEYGVELFTFDEGEWESLADLLGLKFRKGSKRRKTENEKLRGDFEDVISSVMWEDGESDSSEGVESDVGGSTEDDDSGDVDEDDDEDYIDIDDDGDEYEDGDDDGDEETDNDDEEEEEEGEDDDDDDEDYINDEDGEEYKHSDDAGDDENADGGSDDDDDDTDQDYD